MEPVNSNAPVLIVDDEVGFRELISTVLGLSNIKYVMAVDGSDAWKKFNEIKPSIVITDLQMPIITGLELIELIRSANPLIPVVAISSASDMLADALRAGANEAIEKPFSIDYLEGVIKKYLLP
ncbi:MAG: response regulator [Sulfuriflexus sp.]|nr:response regulator [Sulfuriflexus sp.]